MLIQGCNIWETSIPFYSIKVSKPSFKSAPTSSSSIFVDSKVGSKETNEKANEVLKLDILDCWTPENHYRWSKSKISNNPKYPTLEPR